MTTLNLEPTFNVRMTEKQCSALASIVTKYFEAMTREQKYVPPDVAEHVHKALYAMKEAVENKPILTVVQ